MPKLIVSLLSIAMLGGTSVAGGQGMPKPVVDVQMQCNTAGRRLRGRRRRGPRFVASTVRTGTAAERERARISADVELRRFRQWPADGGVRPGRCVADHPGAARLSTDRRGLCHATHDVRLRACGTNHEQVGQDTVREDSLPEELIRALDVGGPIAPMRTGSVVEMTGRGYRWSEFFPCMTPPGSPYGECWMFPDPAPKLPVGFMTVPFPLGVNIIGYVNRAPGNGARKDMGCLMEVAGRDSFRSSLIRSRNSPSSASSRTGRLDTSGIRPRPVIWS